jgi:mono/diheme cytochrome c family protein
MKSFAPLIWPAIIIVGLVILGDGDGRCLAGTDQIDVTNSSPATPTTAAILRSITLPHFEPDLPVEPGRREFIAGCASCHSPRYITMQPPFTRHQWEATVSKMAKAYGAPIDEEQVRAIVDYLETIDGTGTQAAASAAAAGDDDSDSFSSTPLPPDPEPIPVLAVATNADELAVEVTRGATLFGQDCAGCHGAAGRSDGVVSPVLLPRPANLGAAQFSDQLLIKVLWLGVPGTAMPSWRSLPQNDLSSLVAYVQTLHPVAQPEPAARETLARGQALFLKNCSACHGVQGGANGAAAAALMPPPTNFQLEQPDADYILSALQEGVPGTAMPPWKVQLSEPDRNALAGFVRSFYQPVPADER